MWLGEVLTLAVGTLIVLVLIHLAVFWTTRTMAEKPPTVIYVPQPAAAQPTFTQPPENIQSANVPTVEPQGTLPPPIRTRDDRD